MKREPRFDQHIGCWEEPFQDRCERAWDLPREYTARLAQWISDFMDADAGSGTAYYGYECWTTAGWGRDFTQIAQRLERACQFATCDVFPSLNRSSLNRIPPHLCVSAIMLPAEKRDGVRHVHGFLRVPARAGSAPLSLLTVQTNGTNVEILAPRAAARAVHYVRQFAHGAPSSFHLDHRGAHAVDLVADQDRRREKLSYLTASGPEVRSWDLLELVPRRVWQRLVNSWDHAGTEHGDVTGVSAPPSNTA
jgi:hypothetical protein